MDDNSSSTIIDDDDDGTFVGVPSSYEDLYKTLVFFAALFLVGDVLCRRVLRIVPSLTGHIIVGICFGPEGLDWVKPSPEQWVLLGNLGLLLLITQAGLEMDYEILKKVGLRGCLIAVIGSILPISIGTGIAVPFVDSWRSALAAGCSFGPTSAGIAMNVLGQCHVLHTAVGQLIVAAAIVDDILALVVLSQLRALTTDDAQVADIVIPIVSAAVWLVAGGAIALFAFPALHKRLTSLLLTKGNQNISNEIKSNRTTTLSMILLFVLLFGMLPATFYSKASYLMGAFLSGLAFCQNEADMTSAWNHQFKRLIQWLMKIFFAATIGFQVPLQSFGDVVVIARGCLFVLALTGKFLVGLLAPNFRQDRRFRGKHLRDCLVVGLSMMGEAEFAFMVAVFGVTEGLIPPTLYASIVLAILLSTLISPLLLRTTLALYPYVDDDKATNNEHGETNDSDLDGTKDLWVWLIRVQLCGSIHRLVGFQQRISNLGFAVLHQEGCAMNELEESETSKRGLGILFYAIKLNDDAKNTDYEEDAVSLEAKLRLPLSSDGENFLVSVQYCRLNSLTKSINPSLWVLIQESTATSAAHDASV